MESTQCDKCNQPFNQAERKEVLASCGHSFCLVCFQEIVPPQENSLVCPIDHEIFQFSSAFKTETFQKMKQGPYRIICEYHPEEYVKCYCSKCEKLFCSVCGIVNHKEHNDRISELAEEEIGRFCTVLREELISLRNKIDASIQIFG